jgi:vacuolar-type H+-ATPase subunit I/STV1
MDAQQQIQEHMKALAGVIAQQKKLRRREQQRSSALNCYYKDHEKSKEEQRKKYAEKRAAKLASGWVPKPRGRQPGQKAQAILAAKAALAAPAAVENGSANSVANAAV